MEGTECFWALGVLCTDRSSLKWQINLKSCPSSRLAFHLDSPAVILDDPLTNRESQSHPSSLFGSKKWLENLLPVYLVNANASIRDGYQYYRLRAIRFGNFGFHS